MPTGRSPSAGAGLRAAAALLSLALVSPAQAATGDWTSVPLPIRCADLQRIVGLDPGLPRAVVLGEAVRALHVADLEGLPVRGRLSAALLAAKAQPSRDLVPLPGPASSWGQVVLGRNVDVDLVASVVLTDPVAGYLYLALSDLDSATRAFVLDRPRILRAARQQPALALRVFRTLTVIDGRVSVPGGPEADPLWESAVGARTSEADRFVQALLGTKTDVAVLFDALGSLDAARQRFALALDRVDLDRADHFARLARLAGDAGRVQLTHPFDRGPLDLAVMLAALHVDRDGRLRRPASRAFWELAFGSGRLDPARLEEGVLSATDAEPAWLAGEVLVPDLLVRRQRFHMLLLAQRLFGEIRATDVAPAIETLRGSADAPTLTFTLERIGVRDPTVFSAVTRFGEDLAVRDAAVEHRALSQFQGAVALIDRLSFAGSIDRTTAEQLLRALATIRPDKAGRIGTGVANWWRSNLLPALTGGGSARTGGPASPVGDTPIEDRVLEALAGPLVPVGTIEWETVAYRIDFSGPERQRLAEARQRAGGPTIDLALDLFALVADVEAAATGAARAAAVSRLTALGAALAAAHAKVGWEYRPCDFSGLERARQELDRSSRSSSRADGSVAALTDAADEVLAHVFRSLAYLPHLSGDTEGRAYLAGDVAQRHDFGRANLTSAAGFAWRWPREHSVPEQPWRLRGSLLGLEMALARFTLHRMEAGMPARRPLVSELAVRGLVASLVFAPARDATDADRALLVAALGEGRRRLTGAAGARDAATLGRAGIARGRAGLLPWAATEDPGSLERLVSLAELAWLGNPDLPADRLAAWGAATFSIDGSIRTAFPPAMPVEIFLGSGTTGGVGLLATDLKLRLAEGLAALGVPAVLTRAVLAALLQDFMDQAVPAHPDDWLTLSLHARALGRSRLQDAVAALTVAGGPLVPAARAGGSR